MKHASAGLAPKFKSERSAPFTTAPVKDAERTLTIADAVRRCRWIAMDIGASDFGVFLVSPSLERARLIPFFDSGHPATSEPMGVIASSDREEIIKHTRISTLPCWWDGSIESPSRESFAELPMAVRLADILPACPGIAFPVYADRGQCGLVVFLGTCLVLTEEHCLDIHARCFSLFASATAIRSRDQRRTPAISRRELECLRLTSNGLTSEQIAASLKLSVHTANQYLTNSTQKLDAANRTHAVTKAMKLGLIA